MSPACRFISQLLPFMGRNKRKCQIYTTWRNAQSGEDKTHNNSSTLIPLQKVRRRNTRNHETTRKPSFELGGVPYREGTSVKCIALLGGVPCLEGTSVKHIAPISPVNSPLHQVPRVVQKQTCKPIQELWRFLHVPEGYSFGLIVSFHVPAHRILDEFITTTILQKTALPFLCPDSSVYQDVRNSDKFLQQCKSPRNR